ncbi:Protein red1 [Cytospora mali]|uniref:Protein red1 n=1 Tax=Cytospora mali TaxID=578113 RepID=A0A194WAM9_CYTMA|nr:Protein red1 [Valsa mali]
MSQYPYGYGFQGQQPQQQYPYQPYGAYSAPGYGAQQPQQPQQPPPTTSNYYAATQSAYDYNANNIPGLGTPSTTPLFPVPFNGPLDQSGYGTSAPLPSAQYPPYVPNPTPPIPASYPKMQNQTSVLQDSKPPPQYRQNQPKAQIKVQQIQRLTKQPRQQPRDVDSQEEGEISDSQFDDLYDDESNQPSGPQQHTAASASAKSSEDGVVSGTDQEPNFYDTDVDEVPAPNIQSTVALRAKVLGNDKPPRQAEASRNERDRSRSYSPYLSPREVEQDTTTPKNPTTSNTQAEREIQKRPAGRDANAATTAGRSNDTQGQVNGVDRGEEGEMASNGSTTASTPSRSFGTLPEAQNEAKKTILRLLPLGVKFQTYIDEGIDPKVVKDLFTQLNLAPPPPSSAPLDKPAPTQQKKAEAANQEPTEASQLDAKAKKQEERKDKIARLLAEKKAKAAAGVNTESKAPATPVSAGNPSPSVKPNSQSEKNLLLQQKMEALRKAQEARVQKVGKQPTLPQVAKPEVTGEGITRPSAQGPTITPQPSTNSKPNAAARPSPTAMTLSHDAPGPSPVQQTLRIQSPTLTSLSTKQVNQRKRPVAADFVDYPTPAVKKPFLPTRQDSSLVISVSDDDDEDDDDDIDMEMDSPTEDSPPSAPQSFGLPRKAPSLRDYPPLTNRGAPRQLSSPAPGTPGGRAANVDLKAQERAIAELKRKIEEAEARAKAKPKPGSSTPQTPSAGDVTPARRTISTSELDDKNSPSAQLLQEAEAAKLPKSSTLSQTGGQPKIEPSSRLTSIQIPRVKSIVDEKVARIKRMEEELNKLRAEVDETLAVKQHTEEADRVTSDSAADYVQDTQPSNAAVASSGEPERIQSEETSFDAASQSHPMEIESSEKSDDEMDTTMEISQVDALKGMDEMATDGPEASSQDPQHVDTVQPSVTGQPAEAPATMAGAIPSGTGVSTAEEYASDDYEPPDAPNDDRTAADSPPFSPAPAHNIGSFEMSQREAQEVISPMPTQISTAKMPNDDPNTEAHAEFFAHPSSRVEEIPREDTDHGARAPHTSFVDYESPLRYFRAYRFHPQYNDNVAGGFKSLTYSNIIDPKREVCPDELDGQDCPRGGACQFQHFQAMATPDNRIILELGSSDDLMGDQKKNFNNGLRELVASFQKSKVRDFKTIAEGIVEFRRRFLGDSTKILHLEGITI